MPTLYAPTISINDDILTITPNPNNGAFVTGYKIYVDGVLLDTITSTTYDLSEELAEVGTYEIYVTAYATLFIDSEPSNVEEYVVAPIPTGPKVFEVGDVLPATTTLRISWVSDITNIPTSSWIVTYQGSTSNYNLVGRNSDGGITINNTGSSSYTGLVIYRSYGEFNSPYTNYNGNHAYCDIDTSTWNINIRTVTSISTGIDGYFTWEDLNA